MPRIAPHSHVGQEGAVGLGHGEGERVRAAPWSWDAKAGTTRCCQAALGAGTLPPGNGDLAGAPMSCSALNVFLYPPPPLLSVRS